MRILIVEDDPVAQKLLEKQASAFGEIQVASDGEQARKVFEEAYTSGNPFCLALVDIGLPGEDGLDFIASLRLFEKDHLLEKKTPVIVVTGSREQADIAQAQAFEISAYVVKPINPEELKTHLQSALMAA